MGAVGQTFFNAPGAALVIKQETKAMEETNMLFVIVDKQVAEEN